MSSTDLENVEPRSWRGATSTLDIERAKPREENIFAADYYEILRVGPQADEDTIERVYRTLADRFHPDNPRTGDQEAFLRLSEAYETLSNPATRAQYNVLRQGNKGSARFWLRGREFFDGVRGGQNRRLAVLCLLYRRRISTHESPGLSTLDLERLTGCTREELGSALWYLCEKQWAAIGEFTAYSITADGFDFVESKLEDRMEFRSLATLRYYSSPAEREDPHFEPRFWINDTLTLDIEPARTIDGDVYVADHYEILGIGPQADDEAIERVYNTLADRFHPDNPGTGDAKTFLRIREAYDTLSDQTRRAQYNALRQRLKDPARFHLRGREFFDGIKGEQLRRLAVLCLLYRQSASESPGLTVLNLEQLTGCTREELGSALWYLREKKWAKFGEFTEFSITAAGFDVVETKVEEREAVRSRAWLNPEDTRGNEIVHPRISNTVVLENRNSLRIVESEQKDIKAEEQADELPENVEVAQGPMPIEEARDIAKQLTRFEDGAEPEEREAARPWAWLYPEDTDGNEFQNVPVKPEPPASNTIVESQQAGIKAGEPSDEQLAAVPGPAQIEDAPVVTPPGVSRMSDSNKTIAEQAGGVTVSAEKRVIFSMGGKGGVGKTNVMTGLAEWFEENRIPVTLLDLDTENKAKGSLTHFFGGRVPKINIHTPAGLDAFVDILAEEAPAILADMGAGAGKITHEWFDKMYPDVTEVGIVFTAIGVVTSDPASVESVLNWGAALQDRVDYIIVENHLTEHADFTYWRNSEPAEEFRRRFHPAILQLDCRLADLENAARNYGVTLGRIADRTASQPELQKASLVMRAQSYRRRMFAEFDKVKELLLP
jgi:curved DNA-binding protein CbpA/MinD-like ATPase involved in chromosome partitioning or flagellar assembly